MSKGKMYCDAYDGGFHNSELQSTIDRLYKSGLYEDKSTICIIPTRGVIPARVVQSWWGMMTPMNGKFYRIIQCGKEVGIAYSEAIEMILANPDLSKWKYILTLEEDNLIPPDALLKLIEAIEGGVDGQVYDAVGALYYTKGYGGMPMIYGNPKEMPRNFIPQLPVQNSIVPCNGLGMGCTLFRLEMFKDERIKRPLFQTVQQYTPGQGASAFTQDLEFFHKACGFGYKFACDCRTLVGHLDYEGVCSPHPDFVW